MNRDLKDDRSLHVKVMAWLSANGVDPRSLPIDPQASMADGKLTFVQFVTGSDGYGRMVDPAMPDRLATRTVTVPVLVEPDHQVAEWLQPKCSECGR